MEGRVSEGGVCLVVENVDLKFVKNELESIGAFDKSRKIFKAASGSVEGGDGDVCSRRSYVPVNLTIEEARRLLLRCDEGVPRGPPPAAALAGKWTSRVLDVLPNVPAPMSASSSAAAARGGAGGKRRGGPGGKVRGTPTQRAAREYFERKLNDKKAREEDLAAIGEVFCPKSVEILGSDVVIVREGDFAIAEVGEGGDRGGGATVRGVSVDEDEEFWKVLAEANGATRVVRRGEINPDSPVRRSGHRMLYPKSKAWQVEGVPDDTGPGSVSWVTVIEHSISQSFDVCRVMFSRGNVTEKRRFGSLVRRGDVVLDMYAGIGYYALPALIHGEAERVHCCEWNEHAIRALKYNLSQNGVEARAQVHEGDCRVTAAKLKGTADRVCLGLLPSSEGCWDVAVASLKGEGGWLHVHGNVCKEERDSWGRWVCRRLLKCKAAAAAAAAAAAGGGSTEEGSNWAGCVNHVEKVKSFAPNVYHLVADIYVGGDVSFDGFKVEAGKIAVRKMGGGGGGGAEFDVFDADEDVPDPSCALSKDGKINQGWMFPVKL